MGASFIVFADAAHARVDRFPAVHVLDGHLAEEKQHISIVLHGAHKGRLIELLAVVLLRSLRFAVDQGIRAGEVRHRGRIQMAIFEDGAKK